MNILLPTYSYYPFNFGGTEVYVSGLAESIKKSGYSVTIIAGMPPSAFDTYPIFYEDKEIKTIKYNLDEVTVIGIINKQVETEELYTKVRPERVCSWLNVLERLPQKNWDIIHFHAFTSAIGFGILKAVQQKSNGVKVIASYHLPISCTKNTLMYVNTLSDCSVQPTTNECTACIISTSKKIPFFVAKILTRILPSISSLSIPMPFKLKYLVSKSISAFTEFDASVNQWHIFSNQIRQILLLNKVSLGKMVLLRHGVNNIFLQNEQNNATSELKQQKKPTVFLYVGRFEKEKGILTLLKSWCELDDLESRRLELIGEMLVMNEEIRDCIKIASQRKDIVWHGHKGQQQIAEIMQYVHCVIIPSEWVEIGPLVFHEAISCRCNVIASDIGGCRELAIVYSKNSTVFKAGKSEGLLNAIQNFQYTEVTYRPISQNENYNIVLAHYATLLSSY